MIKVGIVGCGVIGGVMKRWLEEHNSAVCIKILDPAKGFNDDLTDIDIAFISIHIETENDGSQNLSVLKNIIRNLPNIPIYIRTTLLPGTCNGLSKEFNKNIFFMPEFLTERTAYADFCSQAMIFTGNIKLLKQVFPNKSYIQMSNLEAEIAKYAHNVFGAVKVTYFNGIYELCLKYQLDFTKVRQGILQSGYINETHTMVPGPDGKCGYGGKCFPKDIKAFTNFVKDDKMYALLEATQNINYKIRNDND